MLFYLPTYFSLVLLTIAFVDRLKASSSLRDLDNSQLAFGSRLKAFAVSSKSLESRSVSDTWNLLVPCSDCTRIIMLAESDK